MTTAQQVFDLYLQCSDAEKQKVARLLLKSGAKMGRSEALPKQGGAGENSLESLLYTMICDQFRKQTGLHLFRLSYLRDTGAMVFLQSAVSWVTRDKPMDVRVRQALLLLCAEAVVLYYRMHNLSITSKLDAAEMLRCIPKAMEHQYPGYRNAGLLVQLAQSVADGRLVKSSEDPLKGE